MQKVALTLAVVLAEPGAAVPRGGCKVLQASTASNSMLTGQWYLLWYLQRVHASTCMERGQKWEGAREERRGQGRAGGRAGGSAPGSGTGVSRADSIMGSLGVKGGVPSENPDDDAVVTDGDAGATGRRQCCRHRWQCVVTKDDAAVMHDDAIVTHDDAAVTHGSVVVSQMMVVPPNVGVGGHPMIHQKIGAPRNGVDT